MDNCNTHHHDQHQHHHQQKQQSSHDQEEDMDLRRGPWTVEEDFTLINYIAHHGEGRWNSLARCAGLKRTGKSCRLRWLNYLRPDVRRGNITLEEQLTILELHSRWGNRWSKIAQHLPGRTDNEIKNYWRTRVQKHAKQLKCDVNSKQFKDTMRYLWMPRLVERIQAAASANANANSTSGGNNSTAMATATNMATGATSYNQNMIMNMNMGMDIEMDMDMAVGSANSAGCSSSSHHVMQLPQAAATAANFCGSSSFTQENSCTAAASSTTDSFGTPASDLTDCYNYNPAPPAQVNQDTTNYYHAAANNHQPQQLNYNNNNNNNGDTLTSPTGNYFIHGLDFQEFIMEQQNNHHHHQLWTNDDVSDCLWNVEDVWFLQQQLG